MMKPAYVALAAIPLAAVLGSADDWPQWGGRNARNFVADERGLPAEFSRGSGTNLAEGAAYEAPKNLRWTAALGAMTYSTPAVANGRIFIGSNDQRLDDPRIPRTSGGLMLCLDEKTGRVLWQLPMPRLKTANKMFNYDDLALGVCSSPVVDGNRVYVVGSRGEVLCLDVRGQADGNDGPYKDEGAYLARRAEMPDKPSRFPADRWPTNGPPVDLSPTDGDILWIYDFIRDLDVWPQDAVDCSVIILGGRVYVCPSNGVDKSHKFIPAPNAPDMIVLDAKTGRLLAANDERIGTNTFHGEWSSPSVARVHRRDQLVWGGGDGVCYAFDPRFEGGGDGATGVLKRIWWFDCNPPTNRIRDGQKLPYNKNHEGPSEILATPVVADGLIYVGVGQDSRHGDGPGCFSCINPAAGTGDITAKGCVWQSAEVHRGFSSAAVTAGLCFVADYRGQLYCFDAKTGKLHWSHDLGGMVFGSPLAVDRKVYIGDDKGKVTVFACSAEKKVLATNRLDGPVYTTPVAANGVLYIATTKTLYAIAAPR